MRFSSATVAFVLACVLQACSLQLRWPGVVHVNDVVVLEWSDGVPPYLIGVVQYPKTVLHADERATSGSLNWRCTVPQGEQIAFILFDNLNNTVDSDWITVQQDLAVATSLMSVSSASASVALQSSMSVLSASLQSVTATPTATSSPQKVPTGPIVGGVVGGVAGLLIIGLIAYWLIRKSKTENRPSVLPTAAPGWHPGGEKDAATLASSNLASSNLPHTSYRPTSAAPTQTSGVYSGLPEVQHPRY